MRKHYVIWNNQSQGIILSEKSKGQNNTYNFYVRKSNE